MHYSRYLPPYNLHPSAPFEAGRNRTAPTDGVAYEISVPLTAAVWYSDFDTGGCVSLSLLTDTRPRL